MESKGSRPTSKQNLWKRLRHYLQSDIVTIPRKHFGAFEFTKWGYCKIFWPFFSLWSKKFIYIYLNISEVFAYIYLSLNIHTYIYGFCNNFLYTFMHEHFYVSYYEFKNSGDIFSLAIDPIELKQKPSNKTWRPYPACC